MLTALRPIAETLEYYAEAPRNSDSCIGLGGSDDVVTIAEAILNTIGFCWITTLIRTGCSRGALRGGK